MGGFVTRAVMTRARRAAGVRFSTHSIVRALGLSGVGLVAAASCPMQAAAQTFEPLLGAEIPFDIERGLKDSVLTRERPELDPLGIRSGSVTIYPQIESGVGFSNNVFGTADDPSSDVFFEIRPAIRVQTNYSRHSVVLSAAAPITRFIDQTIRNQTGYNLAADYNINIHGSSSLYGYVHYDKDYEAQYAGNFPTQAASTIPRRRLAALMRGTYDMGRVRLIANGDMNRIDYSDTRTIFGTVLSQDFRDRTIMRGSGRAEYAVSDITAVFGQFSYSNTDYRNLSRASIDRGSHEIRALGGVTFNLTNLVHAAVGVGYGSRNYLSSQYQTISGLALDVRLQYLLSPITTITASARRDIEDAIISTSPGYFMTTFQLRGDHELLRNLIVNTSARYEHDNFKGIVRTDDLFAIGGGATYTMFRNVQIVPEVQYISRDSKADLNIIGRVFNEFRTTVTARLRI